MDEPARYEIRVAEHLDGQRANWLGDLEIVHSEFGETTLRGEMTDQPALYGVLGKMRDLGLTLISVQRLSPLGARPVPEQKRPEDLTTYSVSAVSSVPFVSTAARSSNGMINKGR